MELISYAFELLRFWQILLFSENGCKLWHEPLFYKGCIAEQLFTTGHTACQNTSLQFYNFCGYIIFCPARLLDFSKTLIHLIHLISTNWLLNKYTIPLNLRVMILFRFKILKTQFQPLSRLVFVKLAWLPFTTAIKTRHVFEQTH
jgi:hypothetical protein